MPVSTDSQFLKKQNKFKCQSLTVRLETLTCSRMFRLFLGIATANSIHIPDIDLIGEHRVMGHTLKLNHTVTEILKTLDQRSLQEFCYNLTLVKFHGIDSALAELPRGWYPFGPFCS